MEEREGQHIGVVVKAFAKRAPCCASRRFTRGMNSVDPVMGREAELGDRGGEEARAVSGQAAADKAAGEVQQNPQGKGVDLRDVHLILALCTAFDVSSRFPLHAKKAWKKELT